MKTKYLCEQISSVISKNLNTSGKVNTFSGMFFLMFAWANKNVFSNKKHCSVFTKKMHI